MSEYSTSKIWQIYENLYPKPHDFLSQDRFFVREGPLICLEDTMKTRYMFLFNDIMLYCNKEGSTQYHLRIHISLRSPQVTVQDVPDRYKYEFQLHCRTRSFVFQCESEEEKIDWMNDLRGSISGDHDTRRSELLNDIQSPKSTIKLGTLEAIVNDYDDDLEVPIIAPPPRNNLIGSTIKRSQNSFTRSNPVGSNKNNNKNSFVQSSPDISGSKDKTTQQSLLFDFPSPQQNQPTDTSDFLGFNGTGNQQFGQQQFGQQQFGQQQNNYLFSKDSNNELQFF